MPLADDEDEKEDTSKQCNFVQQICISANASVRGGAGIEKEKDNLFS